LLQLNDLVDIGRLQRAHLDENVAEPVRHVIELIILGPIIGQFRTSSAWSERCHIFTRAWA
jgi:hypothetical protein